MAIDDAVVTAVAAFRVKHTHNAVTTVIDRLGERPSHA